MHKQMRFLFITLMAFLLFSQNRVLAGRITGTVEVKGLRSPDNVLVYLAKAPAVEVNLSGAKVIMDQRNLTFIPHVLPVLAGTTVHFPNNDKVNHNVFSLSRTKTFNLGSYGPGGANTVVFDKPGIVELRCDVHAEMLAYILVLKNPYWAVTDKKGHFVIPDPECVKQYGIEGINGLPHGKYFVKTWHEKLKSVKKAVVVPDDGEVSLRLSLTRGTPGVLYKR